MGGFEGRQACRASDAHGHAMGIVWRLSRLAFFMCRDGNAAHSSFCGISGLSTGICWMAGEGLPAAGTAPIIAIIHSLTSVGGCSDPPIMTGHSLLPSPVTFMSVALWPSCLPHLGKAAQGGAAVCRLICCWILAVCVPMGSELANFFSVTDSQSDTGSVVSWNCFASTRMSSSCFCL